MQEKRIMHKIILLKKINRKDRKENTAQRYAKILSESLRKTLRSLRLKKEMH